MVFNQIYTEHVYFTISVLFERLHDYVNWVGTGSYVNWVGTGSYVNWVGTGSYVNWVGAGSYVN